MTTQAGNLIFIINNSFPASLSLSTSFVATLVFYTYTLFPLGRSHDIICLLSRVFFEAPATLRKHSQAFDRSVLIFFVGRKAFHLRPERIE